MATRKPRIDHRPREPQPRSVEGRIPLVADLFTVESFLFAYGDTARPPLRATVLTLDEIITDYIIETCHEAAAVATHARRQKIKLDDFKFMLRRDTQKLGRVSELLETDKELKKKRKAFDTEEGNVVKSVEEDGEKGGRGRKRKDAVEESDAGGGADESGGKKKRKKSKKGDDASTVASG